MGLGTCQAGQKGPKPHKTAHFNCLIECPPGPSKFPIVHWARWKERQIVTTVPVTQSGGLPETSEIPAHWAQSRGACHDSLGHSPCHTLDIIIT